jgi:acyl-coenzyme A synthetase/AMP-(fatty) acid ligase
MALSPRSVVDLIASDEITVSYSVPSALMLMMDKGGLFDAFLPRLRAVIFAGEPFPIGHLRRLREHFPNARLLNFYGPTETNVCTFHEVRGIDPNRTVPVPIGRACAGDTVHVDGNEEGELWVEGPTVMRGYWGEDPHEGPYRTGDIVRVERDGELFFVGRRDDVVKVRGNRIALGEIEAALLTFADVREAAVVVLRPNTLEASLVAFLVMREEKPSLLALKKHCAERLPRAMIIDAVRFIDALPRTPNGKVDRARLVTTV